MIILHVRMKQLLYLNDVTTSYESLGKVDMPKSIIAIIWTPIFA